MKSLVVELEEEYDGSSANTENVELQHTIADGYKKCPTCLKNIRRCRFMAHRSICGPKKKCDKTNDKNKVCGAKYVSQIQYTRHCMLVDGKRHKDGTCQKLFGIEPLPK